MADNENDSEKKSIQNEQNAQPSQESKIEANRQQPTQAESTHAQKTDLIAWLKANAKVPKTLIDFEAVRAMAAKSTERKHEIMREQIENAAHVPLPDFTPISKYKRASECSSSWEKMSGSGSMRFCEKCQLMCYDFSTVEIEQARQIVYQREEKENCELYKRKDGKFLSKDCPVGLQAKRRRMLAAVIFGSFILATFYFLSSLPTPEPSIAHGLSSHTRSKSQDHPANTESSKKIVISPDGKQLQPDSSNTRLVNKDPSNLSEFVPAEIPLSAESVGTQVPSSSDFQGAAVPADLPLTPHVYAEKSEFFSPAATGKE